jgi:hypothetical protein
LGAQRRASGWRQPNRAALLIGTGVLLLFVIVFGIVALRRFRQLRRARHEADVDVRALLALDSALGQSTRPKTDAIPVRPIKGDGPFTSVRSRPLLPPEQD